MHCSLSTKCVDFDFCFLKTTTTRLCTIWSVKRFFSAGFLISAKTLLTPLVMMLDAQNCFLACSSYFSCKALFQHTVLAATVFQNSPFVLPFSVIPKHHGRRVIVFCCLCSVFPFRGLCIYLHLYVQYIVFLFD